MLTDNIYTLADLLHVIARLRDPKTGCPWDIQQTHQSLAPYFLEETYETVDAILEKDDSELKEELGDVLLQIVMHSQIAHERKAFDLADVIHDITEKMIRRHPHVFGELAGQKLSEAKIHQLWQQIKAQEGKSVPANKVAAVPSSRPAPQYAYELGEKAASYGFDWPDTESILEKISEEINEVRSSVSPEHQAEEIGDLLFASIQLCRKAGLDPEATLRAASHKFRQRFSAMLEIDSELPENLDDWQKRWNAVKKP